MSTNIHHKIESPKDRQNRHKAMEAIKLINTIKEDFKFPIKSMEYFYDLFERVYCKNEPLHGDKVKVGTMCIQIPSEIIYALDGVPIRLCNGFYTDDEIGSDLLPQKACPLVKATVGHFASGNFSDKPDIVFSPTTCDQKTKAGAIIEKFGHEVIDVDFPRTKESEASREFFRKSIREFTSKLSKFQGKKLSRKNLKDSISKIGYAQSLYHKLTTYRQSDIVPILGIDVFLITNAFFFDKIDNWIDAMEALLEELEVRSKEKIHVAGKISPRIVYTGSPPIFPNYKIPQIIEQSDAIIVADETCSSNRMFNDMVAVDEWLVNDMLDSISDKYLKACTCPIFTKNDDRIRRIIHLAKQYKADGVIYQAFAGCTVYEMEQRSVLEAMEKAGIPILYIESDYSPSQHGQLSTRVEAFIESLKTRRRNKK
ncbi:2-hydroxyacyl-CoA dehydratase subunit D [Arcobacter sp. FWKO B]|uniref:2-hydroxyacyl-CoA dehydratase subunit D n=1 Tax=Arcobacter sp. FWKO B TaxID=2593672 RepID=UPI0018A516CC|nr:2-hydroxyacyl-CoA dehydratase family protein [Arcobacter sp. FWKO B]QOG11403.1 2-hydroxyacyl-CoA dehydratase [Arcobacter sp. FWKO B]